MSQDQSLPEKLPPYVSLEPETHASTIELTGLPPGLLERIIKLKDDNLPGHGSEWYTLSQRVKALKFNRLEATEGDEEVTAMLKDKDHWIFPMPAEWAQFVEDGNPGQNTVESAPKQS